MERRQFLQSTVLGAAATMLGIAPPAAATTPLSFLEENVMSEPIRPYEPLTTENAALVLIDHQVGLMTGFDGKPRSRRQNRSLIEEASALHTAVYAGRFSDAYLRTEAA